MLAAIPTIAVVAGIRQATRDLGLRRRLDGTDLFLEIAAVANSRPRDGRDMVGTAEQCAAIELLTEFGKSEPHLRAPAIAALRGTITAIDGTCAAHTRIRAAASGALARLGT